MIQDDPNLSKFIQIYSKSSTRNQDGTISHHSCFVLFSIQFIFDREKFLVIHREWICIWCILCFKTGQRSDIFDFFSISVYPLIWGLTPCKIIWIFWFKVWLLAKIMLYFQYFELWGLTPCKNYAVFSIFWALRFDYL